MEIPAPFLPAGTTMVVMTIAMLVCMYHIGRIKSRRELFMASLVILGVGLWMAQAQGKRYAKYDRMVDTLFHLDASVTPLVFQVHGSKGSPVPRIEGIYAFSPEQFAVYRGQALSLNAAFAFEYEVAAFKAIKADRFVVTPGALDWQKLPRTYRTANYYHFERGHYSRQRTPNEADMAGEFVCAFIPIGREPQLAGAAHEVLPCRAVTRPAPSGLTILGVLNEKDRTLHVNIQ